MVECLTCGRRLRLFMATTAVIVAGLCLRRFGYDAGLPFIAVKYGGSLLWGTMVYLLVAMLFGRCSAWRSVCLSVLIASAVEFSRLYHTPWLDAFRLTLAGQLLLGRVFSLYNIVAYLAGIGLGVLLARLPCVR